MMGHRSVNCEMDETGSGSSPVAGFSVSSVYFWVLLPEIKFLSEDPEGRDHLEGLGIDGNIILEWILGKEGGKMWSGCIWSPPHSMRCASTSLVPGFRKKKLL
jgi:hypothetical protein